MRSLVSCQKICVPKTFWVQLYIKGLSGWKGSVSEHTVILKTISSWSYMSLMWLDNIRWSVLCYLVLSVPWSAYLHFSEWARFAWSINGIDNTINVINNDFLHSWPNISIYTSWWISTLICVINKTGFFLWDSFYFIYVQIQTSPISTFWTKIRACHLKRYYTTCLHILIWIHNFHVFWLLTWIIYFSSCMVWFFSYF